MVRYIAGDIGGTNSRLQLWEAIQQTRQSQLHPDAPFHEKLIAEKIYSSQSFEKFSTILLTFLNDFHSLDDKPVACCLAVAGPVLHNRAQITNVKWVLDGNTLSKETGIKKISLINDFVGVGYGLLSLKENELILVNQTKSENELIHPKSIEHNGQTIGVIGAGTGLGETYLTWNGREYICHPSEGGHTDFAARNEEEWQLLTDLKNDFPHIKRVSYERFISGMGVPQIYKTLSRRRPSHVNRQVSQVVEMARDKSKTIAEAARQRRCPIAVATMDKFMQLYGAEAGNLALKILPRGGLYIAGGIASKNMQSLFKDQQFYNHFLDKGRMSKLLEEVPIYLVNHPSVGLLGAQVICRRMLKGVHDEEHHQVEQQVPIRTKL